MKGGDFFHRLGTHPVTRVISSTRLAVACLALLFVLVLAGTLFQAGHTAFEAQQKLFYAWVTFLGPAPFPGAQLVFCVLGLNLLASLVFRIRWIQTNAGLIILHAGLMVLLAGGIVSHSGLRSTSVSLVEGHDYGISLDPQRWDLYVESEQGLVSVSVQKLRAGTFLESPLPGLSLVVVDVLPNSRLVQDGAQGGIAPVPRNADPAQNVPAVMLTVADGAGYRKEFPLSGADPHRTKISTSSRSFTLWLAHTAYQLPALLRLLDFRATFYPGSDVPRSFESTILLNDQKTSREAVISMNRPLRYRGYTFYQNSYGTDDQGRRFSVIEVVRNPGRLFPYVSALVILLGLAAHVLLRRESHR